MTQERRLMAMDDATRRERLLDETRQAFLAKLADIKVAQITQIVARNGRIDAPVSGAVVSVAALSGGRLILPWEDVVAVREFERRLREGAFAAALSEAETLEIVSQRHEDAAAR
jgi:hypothetical protein